MKPDTEVGKAVAQKLKAGFSKYIESLKNATAEGFEAAKNGISSKLREFGINAENLSEELEKIKDSKDLKAFAENLSGTQTKEAAKNVITEVMENGKIKQGLGEEAKKVAEGVQSAAKKLKLKAAGIYAAVGLAVLGALGYIMSDKKENDTEAA